MNPLEELENLFRQFPGIGPRQAKRFVYFVLRKHPSYRTKLANTLQLVGNNVHLCERSFQYFYSTEPSQTLSPIMRDEARDKSILMIVEKDTDLESIESARVYNGHYFVLGGHLSVLEKNPEQKIRLNELRTEVNRRKEDGSLKEVIFALSTTPHGDFTTDFLKQGLKNELADVQTSQPARGLSNGLELEYSDKDTLRNALEGRK
jgi:recombination protein RecR